MYVIINNENKVYDGSFNNRHMWSDQNRLHFQAIIFPLLEEAEDINRILNVEGTKVVPIAELSI